MEAVQFKVVVLQSNMMVGDRRCSVWGYLDPNRVMLHVQDDGRKKVLLISLFRGSFSWVLQGIPKTYDKKIRERYRTCVQNEEQQDKTHRCMLVGACLNHV